MEDAPRQDLRAWDLIASSLGPYRTGVEPKGGINSAKGVVSFFTLASSALLVVFPSELGVDRGPVMLIACKDSARASGEVEAGPEMVTFGF